MIYMVVGVSIIIGGLVMGGMTIWTWSTPLYGTNPLQRFMARIMKWYSLFFACAMIGSGFFILFPPTLSPLALNVLTFGGGIILALVGVAAAALGPWTSRYMFRRFYHGQALRAMLTLTIAALEGFAVMLLSLDSLMLSARWPMPIVNAVFILIFSSMAVWMVSTLAAITLAF